MSTIPSKLGRYDIIREVGRGAMGVVYKAHDPVIEREVAVKAINLSFEVNEEEKNLYLSRFFREAKAAGKLNHPGIVTIFDVGEDKESGVPFIVMEFLEGTTLQEITRSGNLLPVSDINNIIAQLAEALHYAHQEGVIHRDVKPANILILPGMKAKITDFGIARLAASDLTQSGQFIGTPNYMSPEQLAGKSQIDGRADLFSLGVIFYMMLTGERPFSGESFNTVSYKIAHVDPEPPKVLNPSIPEAYNAILARLLAKDPADRYASGEKLVEDIKSMNSTTSGTMATETTAAAPPPPGAASKEPPGRQMEQKQSAPAAWRFFPSENMRNLVLFSGMLVFLGAIAAGVYLFRSPKHADPAPNPVVSPPSVAAPPAANSSIDKKEIEDKLKVAKNHILNAENGPRRKRTERYNMAIESLNQVLERDPANKEANKLRADIQLIISPPQTPEKNQETVPAPPAPEPPKKQITPSKTPSKVIVPSPGPPPLVAPAPTVAVTFSMQHNFPSGSILIYLGDQLITQSQLEGQEKKKFLVIKTYEGNWEKTLQIQAGEANLKIQVNSPDGQLSKATPVKFQEGVSYRIQIRYLKATKDLEVRIL